MDKGEIKAFFDELAASWDENQCRNEEVISIILDKSGITEGIDVLDVASGTGVLFGDYLNRGVSSLMGIDISDKMLKIAKEKFPGTKLICGDAESYTFEDSFDAIVIYNAFPHFVNPDRLFENLAGVLKPGGRLTVAHGMSMAELEKCHSGSAEKVSQALPFKEELAEMMAPYLNVDVLISDDRMYMVSGFKSSD